MPILDNAGSHIHYWDTGAAKAPVVVMSHGASMDHRMFDAQAPPLTAAGYRLITWDARGHGLSQPLGKTPIGIGDHTNDLVAVLDHLGITSPVCIGGQSMGGYITQSLVIRQPWRVSAVVIIGATCTTWPIPRWQALALRSSPWWFTAWPWNSLTRTMAKATALQPAVRAYARDAISMMRKPDFIKIWRGVTQAITPDMDHRIPVPWLLTHGEQDRTGTIARESPLWAEREPHCRYEVVPDAAHNANQDNPDYFNGILMEFLSEHYPAGSQ